MLRLMTFFDDKMKANFTIWDYSFLKLYGALFGLVLGAYFSEFVIKYQWLFIAVFMILLVRYLYLLFVK